jgi:hypothetical protein
MRRRTSSRALGGGFMLCGYEWASAALSELASARGMVSVTTAIFLVPAPVSARKIESIRSRLSSDDTPRVRSDPVFSGAQTKVFGGGSSGWSRNSPGQMVALIGSLSSARPGIVMSHKGRVGHDADAEPVGIGAIASAHARPRLPTARVGQGEHSLPAIEITQLLPRNYVEYPPENEGADFPKLRSRVRAPLPAPPQSELDCSTVSTSAISFLGPPSTDGTAGIDWASRPTHCFRCNGPRSRENRIESSVDDLKIAGVTRQYPAACAVWPADYHDVLYPQRCDPPP